MTAARTRARVAWLALLLVGLAAVAPQPSHAGPARAVLAIGLTVTDLERSVAFFSQALGFEVIGRVDASGPAYDALWNVPGARARIARLRLGQEHVELTEFSTPKGRPVPEDSRSNDLWFQHLAIVVSDMDAAHARLVARGARALSPAPQVLPPSNAAAAGIAAFYFHDPDGHVLELIHYPRGKGDPRWQETGRRLFLGIDHTAIAVRDTAASVAFYRDHLGLAVVGESLNVGIEQERLTGVPGARVRITSLRAPGGAPGIELLDYRAPRDGRRLWWRTHVTDTVHWHVTLAASPAADAPAVFVRDPDGHALQLVGF